MTETMKDYSGVNNSIAIVTSAHETSKTFTITFWNPKTAYTSYNAQRAIELFMLEICQKGGML